jgi:hypothetical protein
VRSPVAVLLALATLGGLARAAPVRANPIVQLSWNSCDDQHEAHATQAFTARRAYTLVVSATGFEPGAHDNVARETVLRLVPQSPCTYPEFPILAVPDAWRFDPAGCQGGRFTALAEAFDPGCPLLQGAAPGELLVSYQYDDLDPDHLCCRLWLSRRYDLFRPASAAQRYTLWQVVFDMTRAVAGPGAPGQTCGGGDGWMAIFLEFGGILTPGNEYVPLAQGPETEAYWLGGDPTRTAPATWARVKAAYR